MLRLRRSLLCLLSLAACGRVGFTELDARVDARIDTAPMPIDAPPAVDCTISHPTATFCDGFEGPTLDPWDYTVIEFGRADRTTARAYRGVASLETETDSSANYHYARWSRFLDTTVTAGDIYLRAFYWISSATVVNEQLGILVVGNGTPPYPATYVVLYPGQIMINVDGDATLIAGEIPRDRWVCIEMHVFVDPVVGFAELSIDGTNVLRTPNVSSDVVGGYTNMEVGVHYTTPGQTPVSLWVDEVVLDSVPIGCT